MLGIFGDLSLPYRIGFRGVSMRNLGERKSKFGENRKFVSPCWLGASFKQTLNELDW